VKKAKLSQSNSLWHNRNYLLLWSGQTISSVGSGVSQIAFPLLILMLTHSPAQAGFAGALLARPVQQRFSYGQAIIAILWLYPLPYVLLAVAPTPLILGGLLAAGLLVDATYNVVQFSYRLALIPDELQGRVNSSFRLISYSLRPLGQVLTGVLLQDIGPIFTILAFSLCLVLLAVAASLNPRVRKAR